MREEILTVNEAAELVRRHPSTIYRRLEAEDSPWHSFAFKEGKDWRIEREGMLAFLKQRPIHTRRPAEDPMPRVNAGSSDRFRAILAQKRKAAA